jgi:hypothetical protein
MMVACDYAVDLEERRARRLTSHSRVAAQNKKKTATEKEKNQGARQAMTMSSCAQNTAASSPSVMGGWSSVDNAASPGLIDKLVAAAVASLPPQSSGMPVVQVLSAKQQVVAGMNYALQLRVPPSQQVYTVVLYQPLPYTGLPLRVTSVERA